MNNNPYHARLLIDCNPMEKVSAYIEYMTQSVDRFKYLTRATYNKTNFVFAILLKMRHADVISSFTQRLTCIFGPPKLLIVDKDIAFRGKAIRAF